MAKKLLDCADVVTSFEQVVGEAVAKRMATWRFAELGGLGGASAEAMCSAMPRALFAMSEVETLRAFVKKFVKVPLSLADASRPGWRTAVLALPRWDDRARPEERGPHSARSQARLCVALRGAF